MSAFAQVIVGRVAASQSSTVLSTYEIAFGMDEMDKFLVGKVRADAFSFVAESFNDIVVGASYEHARRRCASKVAGRLRQESSIARNA